MKQHYYWKSSFRDQSRVRELSPFFSAVTYNQIRGSREDKHMCSMTFNICEKVSQELVNSILFSEQYSYWGWSQTKGVPKHCRFSLQWEVLATFFFMHLPSLHGELRVCKEKTNKITLNVSKCNTFWGNFKFGNCFTTSMKTGNLLLGRYEEKCHQREVTRKRVKWR